MNLSFYNGGLGARMQQEKLNVIANNVANVNSEGFKAKNATFSNLIYMNQNASENAVTGLKAGAGLRLEKTDTKMDSGALIETSGDLHFAVIGEGLFALQNPVDASISYTRNGSFISSERKDGAFYLSTNDGYLVLDKNKKPISLSASQEDEGLTDEDDQSLTGKPVSERIGLFKFDNYNDMISAGGSRLIPVEKNGYPVLSSDASIKQGALESSNVDFAQEMARMIETQRAYQFALRMVTTSDEIEGTINSLRG